MDPGHRELMADWETGARRLLARFRADAAEHLDDPGSERLISWLRESSREFRTWWEEHEVRGSGEGRKLMRHPDVGDVVWEHATFRHAERPEPRLVLYTPTDATVPRVRVLLDRYASSTG
jgi:hypothetical protein